MGEGGPVIRHLSSTLFGLKIPCRACDLRSSMNVYITAKGVGETFKSVTKQDLIRDWEILPFKGMS